MNTIPFLIAVILAVIALITRRSLLRAISVAVLVGIPAYQPSGLRSAIFVQEIVISVAFFVWLLRSRNKDVIPVSSSMVFHLAVIIFYIIIVTWMGYLRLNQLGQATIRSLLAGLRVGAVVLVFIIPAFSPLSEKAFVSVLRFFWFALICFLLLTFLDYMGVVKLQQSAELTKYGVQIGLGGFNRTSTGNMAQYGLFVTILLVWMKRLPIVLGIVGMTGFIGLTLLSLSRTNLVAVCVFGFMLLLTSKGNRFKSLLFLLVAVVGAAVIVVNVHFVGERFSTMIGSYELSTALRTGGRLFGWKAAVRYLMTHYFTLLFGTGYDNWSNFLASATGLAAGHNGYLHAWGELGLLGASIYYAFFFRIGTRFIHAMRANGDTNTIGRLSLCLLAALMVANLTAEVMISSLTMNSSMHAQMFLFGLIIGRLRHPSAWGNFESEEYIEGYAEETEALTYGAYCE